MVKFIKAYNEGEKTVFELSVTALSRRGAKFRASMSLLGRRPSEISSLDNIEVITLDTGRVKDYRVLISLDTSQSLKDKLMIPEARAMLERLL